MAEVRFAADSRVCRKAGRAPLRVLPTGVHRGLESEGRLPDQRHLCMHVQSGPHPASELLAFSNCTKTKTANCLLNCSICRLLAKDQEGLELLGMTFELPMSQSSSPQGMKEGIGAD